MFLLSQKQHTHTAPHIPVIHIAITCCVFIHHHWPVVNTNSGWIHGRISFHLTSLWSLRPPAQHTSILYIHLQTVSPLWYQITKFSFHDTPGSLVRASFSSSFHLRFFLPLFNLFLFCIFFSPDPQAASRTGRLPGKGVRPDNTTQCQCRWTKIHTFEMALYSLIISMGHN